jgi:predicted secreted acid phosphatase
LWGRGWIVLPNAMYGSWEGALFGYDQKLTDEQALRLKKSRLRGTD